MIRTSLAITVTATAALASVAHAAQPRTVKGWPVPAAVGSVHLAPDGTAVLISEGFTRTLEPVPASSVAKFGLGGTLTWVNAKAWGCGNCDDGPQAPELQPTNVFGPIGPDGDGVWGVALSGTTVPGCVGVALADGTCIGHGTKQTAPGAPFYPVVSAFKGSTVLWEHARPNLSWTIDENFLVAPLVVHDGGGIVYTQLGAGFEPAGAPVPARMIALSETTGALKWQVADATPVAAFSSGVLAITPAGLVRYAQDGTVTWTSAGWTTATAGRIAIDETHARLYVSPQPGSTSQFVAALDPTTGVEIWRTKAADRAELLSVDADATAYVSINKSGRFAMRAIGANGVGKYQWASAAQVAGTRRLTDGTVAISAGARPGSFQGDAGLLWRVDPTKTAPSVSRTKLALSRTTFASKCAAIGCQFKPGFGTVLRIAVPGASTFKVTLRTLSGKRLSPTFTITAPAGSSAVRLFGANAFAPSGRRVIEIRGTVRGTLVVRRIPVRIL